MMSMTGSLNEQSIRASDIDDSPDNDDDDDDDDDDHSPLVLFVEESDAEPEDKCGGSSISTTLLWLMIGLPSFDATLLSTLAYRPFSLPF
jgi:hypothetical protein